MAAHVEASGVDGRRRIAAVGLYGTAAVATGAAVWWILAGASLPAGLAAAVAGAVLLVAAVNAHRVRSEPERAVGAIADRLFDALLLSSIAWTARASSPAVAAGALLALTAGFLASYVRARSAGLGYEVEESLVTRGFRYGLVAAGLAADLLGPAVWAVAGLGALSSLVRGSQVLKEERQ